jgi:hypothetical protein
MFRSAFSKALTLQLNKSAAHACKKRVLSTCAVTTRSLKFTPCQHYHNTFKRAFASVPESVVIKSASTKNGIDITERAVKVLMMYSFCIVCRINNIK